MECPKAILLYSNLGAWGIPIFETTTYAHICVQKKHKYEVTFFLHRVCFQGEIGPPIFTHIEVINGVFQLSQPMDLTKRLGVIPWIGSVVHIVGPRGCFEVGIELTHLRSQQLFMNWWLIRDPWRMQKKKTRVEPMICNQKALRPKAGGYTSVFFSFWPAPLKHFRPFFQ